MAKQNNRLNARQNFAAGKGSRRRQGDDQKFRMNYADIDWTDAPEAPEDAVSDPEPVDDSPPQPTPPKPSTPKHAAPKGTCYRKKWN